MIYSKINFAIQDKIYKQFQEKKYSRYIIRNNISFRDKDYTNLYLTNYHCRF